MILKVGGIASKVTFKSVVEPVSGVATKSESQIYLPPLMAGQICLQMSFLKATGAVVTILQCCSYWNFDHNRNHCSLTLSSPCLLFAQWRKVKEMQPV